MSYKILKQEDILPYLSKQQALQALFKSDSQVDLMVEGNLNNLFKITTNDAASSPIILKQSLPYIRCLGEQHKLDKRRILMENKAFSYYAEHANGVIPRFHHFDESMCLLVMEYLHEHKNLTQALLEGLSYPQLARQISEFMANIAFATSKFSVKGRARSQLFKEFNNEILCPLTEQFVFTYPFELHDNNRVPPGLEAQVEAMQQDKAIIKVVKRLKKVFKEKRQGLIHGDLHTGSLLVNEKDMRVIDTEFAMAGPFGFDLGTLIAHFMLAWIHHLNTQGLADGQWYLEMILKVSTFFMKKFASLAEDVAKKDDVDKLNAEILQHTAGFAGIEIFRRLVGAAHSPFLTEIKEPDARFRAMQQALIVARRLLLHYHEVTEPRQLLQILQSILVRKPS